MKQLNPNLPPAINWRGRFPFKIGAPSWVFPFEQNNLINNVKYLSQNVDRVQLLLFGKDYLAEMLVPSDLRRLSEIQRDSGLAFSIHLPSDLFLLDSAINHHQLSQAFDIIDQIWQKTALLQPEISVLHVDSQLSPTQLDEHEPSNHFEQVLDALLKRFPNATKQIIIENTTIDLCRHHKTIAASGLGICADFGHLYHNGQSISEFIDCLGPLIKELHLHGFNQTGDHLALSQLDENIRIIVCSFLADFRGPVTLEIFQADQLWPSLELLHSFMQRNPPC